MAKLEETIREYAQRGRDAVASASNKAGEQIQRFGETVIQTLDTRQLKVRLRNKYTELGTIVWEHHRDGKRISFKTKQFESLLDDISRTVDELEGRTNLKKAETE